MNKTVPDEFASRFERHAEELKTLYTELYGNDEQAFAYFTRVLEHFYLERNEDLRSIDRKREADPGWYKGHDMVGMMLYVDAFAGSLKGVREKLGYIEDCGVNYLHLMPLLESPEGRSDGGYAVSDFRTVEPELGTMEDLAGLTAECHRRGISGCLDFVMNHTSEDHEWAKRAKAGEKEFQDRYFFFDGWDVPNEYEKTVPEVFPATAPGNFSWCPEAGKVVMTTFHPYQWDLNFANPVVFNDMTANMLFLCNRGIDVIRLDAVPYIWKELGTTCRNLPQVHTLSRILHIVCDIVCPGTLLLGEVVMEPARVVPYFGSVENPECHMLYNVTTMATLWHTVATKDVRLLEHQLGQVFALPHEYTFLNYLRCHDDIGWGLDYDYLGQFGIMQVPHKKYLNDYLTGKWPGSPARGELYNDDPRLGDARLCGTTASLCGLEAARYERDDIKTEAALRLDVMLHACMFTLSGIPVLYSGDEIGAENNWAYHEDPLKAEDSRYLHRGAMNWEKAAGRKDPDSVEGRLFRALKKLETIRADRRVFDGEADTWIVPTGSDSVLGVGRYLRGEKLIALFNFSDREQTVSIDEDGNFTDLLTGRFRRKNGLTLKAGDFIWMLCDFNKIDKKKKNGKKAENKKKLIFLDIDGTLTTPGSNVPPESALEAIRAAQANGHLVFLCSGRNYAMLSPLLKYGFDGAVASGGGYVFSGDKVLYDCPMTAKQADLALSLFRQEKVFRTIEALDASYCDDGMAEFLGRMSGGNSELIRWRKAIENALDIRPISRYDGRPIYKIVFMCEDESQLAPVKEALEDDFEFLVQDMPASGCINGEMINRRFNKGTGVRLIAKTLGIDISDTIGFGDSMNDLEMIQTVGTSVCMDNGSPALKKISSLICPAVEEDGLMKGFEALGLLG